MAHLSLTMTAWTAKSGSMDDDMTGNEMVAMATALDRQTKRLETIQRAHVRVGVAVLVRRGPAFLIGRRKGSHGAGTWSVPGGHLELGETVEECAQRELAEECGIRAPLRRVKLVAASPPLTTFPAEDGGASYITIYTLVDVSSEQEAALLEPNKCGVWVWAEGLWPEPLFKPLLTFLETVRAPKPVHLSRWLGV